MKTKSKEEQETRKYKNNPSQQDSRATVLPVFKGYTVDVRLRQFRRVNPDTSIEFLDFDSQKGDELLGEYINTLDKDSAEFREIAACAFTRG